MDKLTVFLAIAFCAMFANAANIKWTNATGDGKWDTDGNWEGGAKPTGDDDAVFPDADTTVTVDGDVKAAIIRTVGNSNATISFTGQGSIEVTSDAFVQTSWTSANFDFNVDVKATPSNDRWISIYNNNTFRKNLDLSTHKLCIRNNSTLSLVDNANVTAKYINMGDYSGNSLLMSGNAVLNVTGGDNLIIKEGATLSVTGHAALTVARDLKVDPGAAFTLSDGAVLTLRSFYPPFSAEEGVSDELVMGGEIRAISPTDNNSYVYMPYTNATKTISGSGTIFLYRIYYQDASNLVIRLNGPDLYIHDGYVSSSTVGYLRTRLEIGGGSTLGVWGGDYKFERWTNRVVGVATVDTTDYLDKTTPRTVDLAKLFDCSGELTAKGLGTLKLSGVIEYPNLSLAAVDSATISFTSAYALEDITLHDSSKLAIADYLGHKTEESHRHAKSLAMDGTSSLDVGRYVILTGDATFSGNASAVIGNKKNESGAIFTCADLSLADDASLSVTGTISATSLSISGNAHLAFTAGTTFTAGAAFGTGNWTMEIRIPSGYEAGIRPVVTGAKFAGDFADHVTLVGDATGWSAQTLGDDLILYTDSPASGIEWIGDSQTSDSWSDTANWHEGNVPSTTDAAAFGGLNRLTPSLDSAITVSSLVFRASAGPFVLSGSETLSLTADCGSRGSASPENASIASHSSFDQTIAVPVDFGKHNVYLVSDGGGALKLTHGFTAGNDWHYFVMGGDVRVGGTCSVGVFSFKASTTATPSCLRVLPGGQFTIRSQGIRGLVENNNYIGRIVVDEGGVLAVTHGDCAFWYGRLENVIDGTLIVAGDAADDKSGRLVGTLNEQYYVGKGSIYADSARSGRDAEVASHYINFGGTLKLYMNGNWYTATYMNSSESVAQHPNYPTRFRMTDGTTLGAANDWTYGPMEGAYDTIAATITPAARKSIMTGTVTVDTQNPTNDTAHTITFVDPLDASAANVVKAGAGTLAFNEPEGYPSSISNLSVNAGTVRFGATAPAIRSMSVADGATASFATAPILSGTLTVDSAGSNIRSAELSPAEWRTIATAAEILGPAGATEWKSSSAKNKYRIVTSGDVQVLQGRAYLGMSIVVR
jgi:hypothetical protein